MDALAQDLRYACRTLLRSPGFTLVAAVTLALGIGANTAIFSVIDGVLLRPLPYEEPQELVRIWNQWEGTPDAGLSPPEYLDYRDRVSSFSSMGVYADGTANLPDGDAPERVEAAFLSAGVFPTLGVEPALGRVYRVEEDRPGTESVVVLAHGLWVRRFGAAPDVVGREIRLGSSTATVIGVMPPEFRLPEDIQSGGTTELFVPLRIDESGAPNRGSHFLSGVGRLRPGATPAQASAEIAAVAREFVAEYPDDYPAEMAFGARVVPLGEDVLGPVRPVLLILLGAVGFVLLIACVNVANLMLARADRRQRELAVRGALGAGRGRLIRQLMLESGILALLGGAGGLLLALLGVELLVALQPPNLPSLDAVRIDPRVVGFTLAVSLLTTALFGLMPALHASRPALQSVLRESARGATAGTGRQRFRSALVAAEVALAVVLLLGAGLLVRSFLELQRVDPGFRTESLLTLRLSLPSSDYPDEQVAPFFARLLEQTGGLPGVQSAGAVSNLPLASSLGDLNFRIEGREVPEGDVSPRADWQVVTPGYFRAMGMQLIRGRGIEARDGADAPGVIVLNESAAQQYWPGGDALGQRLLLGGGAGPGWVTVVGIVRDVRHGSLDEAPRPEMYLSHAQFRFWNGGGPVRSLTLALRTAGEPLALSSGVRQEVRRLDASLPVSEIRSMEQVRSASVAEPRFLTLLLGIFSGVAMVLAIIGVYAVLAYSVAQRTHEIGVRMALGARSTAVVTMVVRRGLTLTLTGIVVGELAALAVTRVLAERLYGVSATDALTFVAVPLLLALVALAAAYHPARRAVRVDPLVALRAD